MLCGRNATPAYAGPACLYVESVQSVKAKQNPARAISDFGR